MSKGEQTRQFIIEKAAPLFNIKGIEATAMSDIMEAINNKEHVAYITKRWKKVADLLATIPTDLYNALSARPGGGF